MNQKRVTKIIMEEDKFKNNILIFLEQRTRDKILLSFNHETKFQNISIENLESVSKKSDEGKTFEYVVQLIIFLSNLARGNNYTAIYALRPLYPFSTCVNIITNPQLAMDLRGAFTQLVTKLWTSSGETHHSYLKRFYCKVWSKINMDDLMIHNEDDFTKTNKIYFRELWTFIKNHFNSQLDKAFHMNFATINYYFTLSLLELSLDLLKNDIISSSEDIDELRDIVSRLLNEVFKDIGSCKDKDPEERDHFIQCKMKLIEIYRIILIFDNERFVRTILADLKLELDVKQNTEDFDEGEGSSPKENRLLSALKKGGPKKRKGPQLSGKLEKNSNFAKIVLQV